MKVRYNRKAESEGDSGFIEIEVWKNKVRRVRGVDGILDKV